MPQPTSAESSVPAVASAGPRRRPLGASLFTGLLASLCCGGTLIFASIGLGAFWSSLGMSRFIPQALALGTATIVVINYASYRRRATKMLAADPGCDCASLRRSMVLSGALGLLMMAASFILLEWLNHAVVHPERLISNPEYAQGLILGVPNEHLLYTALTFLALPLLAVLPLPQTHHGHSNRAT